MPFIQNLFNKIFNIGSLPTAKTALVSGNSTGSIYALTRLLGSSSTLALVSGTNSNLTIVGDTLSAASSLGTASQTAVVREQSGQIAVEYPITLTGNTAATPTPTPTPTPSPTSAPLAPSVVAYNGDGQVAFDITDNPSSVGVKRWGLYEGTVSGGAKTFVGWFYRNDQLQRRFLINGNTAYYTVVSWNSVGTSPQSTEVSASAISGATPKYRLLGTIFFPGTAFTEQLGVDYATATDRTITVTSSDGTTLTVEKSGPPYAYLVSGTFATTGTKTLTISDGVNSNTQRVDVIARRVATSADVMAVATEVQSRANNKQTYTYDANLSVTNIGSTLPSGYTTSATIFYGPPQAGSYTAYANVAPPQYAGTVWDEIEDKVVTSLLHSTAVTNNTLVRMRLFKQTFLLSVRVSEINYGVHVRYSDDNGNSWKRIERPTYLRKDVAGSTYLKIDPGSTPPAAGRIWEIEIGRYGGMGGNPAYEAGETPQAVTLPSTLRTLIAPDSFANGIDAMNVFENQGRTATRDLGLFDFFNNGINSNNYRQFLYRLGANTSGSGAMSTKPDVIFLNFTINDNALGGAGKAAYYQTVLTNVFLRVRYLRPGALIIFSYGMWSPNDASAALSLYDAVKGACAEMASDKGFYFNDGVAQGWSVASGATGSDPRFYKSGAFDVTISTSGNILTVTGSPTGTIEYGSHLLNNGADTFARVLEQLTNTDGGGVAGKAGTYLLDASPKGGDFASGSVLKIGPDDFTTAYSVHPNSAGQTANGHRLSAGAITLATSIVSSSSTIALTTEGSDFITSEAGDRLILE